MTTSAPQILAEAAKGGSGGNLLILFFIPVMILLFWFMSRNQKKKMKKEGEFRTSLTVGQRVMTSSGMIGTIVQIDGDIISVRSLTGDVTSWIRQAVRQVVSDEEFETMTTPFTPLEDLDQWDEDDAEAAADKDEAKAQAEDGKSDKDSGAVKRDEYGEPDTGEKRPKL